MILAVDPSVLSAGVALFDEQQRLCGAYRIRIPVIKKEDPGERWRRVANMILWAPKCPLNQITRIISERPQIYQRENGKTKGDPNTLLGMVGVIGAIAGVCQDASIITFEPHVWKGQLSKELMCRRILATLSSEECRLVPDSHDAIDAVGIGLHYFNRLKPIKVFPGAT